jgi:hypothetical protein
MKNSVVLTLAMTYVISFAMTTNTFLDEKLNYQ